MTNLEIDLEKPDRSIHWQGNGCTILRGEFLGRSLFKAYRPDGQELYGGQYIPEDHVANSITDLNTVNWN
jgi:hypothetical protein